VNSVQDLILHWGTVTQQCPHPSHIYLKLT